MKRSPLEWNGFATKYDGGATNVGQVGIGLTVH